MRITKRDLRENYAAKETEELLSLCQTRDLTDETATVLREVLEGRGDRLPERSAPRNPYEQPRSNLVRSARFLTMQAFFRSLVVIDAVIFIFWFYLYARIESRFLSLDTLEVLGFAGYNAVLPLNYWLHHLLNFAWLAVSVGLYQFSPWARQAFLLLFGLEVILAPFQGLIVDTAPSMAIAYLMNTTSGLVIGLCFFSSISHKFSGK